MDLRLDDAYLDELTRTYVITAWLMLGAIALSFLDWRVGLGLAAALTLYHLRAPPWPVYEAAEAGRPSPEAEQT